MEYNLIIVDDEIATCNFLEKFINEKIENINVIATMKNGEDAIKFIQSNNVNIILSDIRMPRVNGIELSKYVYENRPDIKVILMSAYNEFSYAQEALKYNVFYYLLKAIDLKELKDIFFRIKGVLSTQIARQNGSGFEEREKFICDVISENEVQDLHSKELSNRLCITCEINDINFGIYVISFSNYKKCMDDNVNYGEDSFKLSLLHIIEYVAEYQWVFYIEKQEEKYLLITGSNKEIKNRGDIFVKRCTEELSHVLCQTVNVEFNLECQLNELSESLKKIDLTGTTLRDTKKVLHETDKNSIIEEAVRYINENYNKDLSRDDIAKHVYLSGSYFGRMFKNYIGVSFSEYLMQIRMNKAVELLNTNERMTNIASLVGYNNGRHFRRVFYMYTGYSPSDYRKNMLKKDKRYE